MIESGLERNQALVGGSPPPGGGCHVRTTARPWLHSDCRPDQEPHLCSAHLPGALAVPAVRGMMAPGVDSSVAPNIDGRSRQRVESTIHRTHWFSLTPFIHAIHSSCRFHPALAPRERIDAAFRVAHELRFPLRIEALDQLTAATALGPGMMRAWSEKDGVVEGLEAREYFGEGRPPWPLPDARSPGFAAIQQRRAEAWARSGFPERRAGDPEAVAGESIWWCDFLWNRTYVSIGGHVRPCCVIGVPALGNVAQEPFEQVWNNDAHRVMRQRMVKKQPVTACRGCMHIKEISDPVEIDRLLQGRRVPRTGNSRSCLRCSIRAARSVTAAAHRPCWHGRRWPGRVSTCWSSRSMASCRSCSLRRARRVGLRSASRATRCRPGPGARRPSTARSTGACSRRCPPAGTKCSAAPCRPSPFLSAITGQRDHRPAA